MNKPDIILQLEKDLKIEAKLVKFEEIKKITFKKNFSYSLDNDGAIIGIRIESPGGEKIPEYFFEQNIQLKSLNLSNNQISDIKPIEKLINLNDLSLSNNQISDIKPIEKLINLNDLSLSNNQISDIKPIEKLINLNDLSLSNNQISDIKPIEKLINLNDLSLSNNQISDIKPIEKLINLNDLSLSNNQISDIKPIEKLINLNDLYLSNNQISDIKPIEKLINLTYLSLYNNQISDIKPIEKLINLTYLSLYNNPYINDKKYKDLVVDKNNGFEQTKIVKAWFQVHKESEKPSELKLPVRILLLGNSNIGKTCLRKYLIEKENKDFCDNHNSTHIAEVAWWDYREDKKAHIWDFGGQDYYHSVHHLFFTTSSLYILLYRSSDIAIKRNEEYFDFTPTYWLENIEYIAPDIINNDKTKQEDNKYKTILLAENKTDISENNLAIPDKYRISEKYRISICPNGQAPADNSKYQRKLDYFVEEIKDELSELEKRNTMSIAGDYADKINDIVNHNLGSKNDVINKFHYSKKKFIKLLNTTDDDVLNNYILPNLHNNGLILYYNDIPDNIWLYPDLLIREIHDKLENKTIDEQKGKLEEAQVEFLKEHNLLKLLKKQEVIFQDPDTDEYIFPQFLELNAKDSELYEIAKMNLKPVFSLKFDNFLPSAFMTRVITRFGTKPEKKFYTRYEIIFTESLDGKIPKDKKDKTKENSQNESQEEDKNKIRVWIKTDLEKLRVDVFISETKSNIQEYIEYLFKALIAAYYGNSPFNYLDYVILEKLGKNYDYNLEIEKRNITEVEKHELKMLLSDEENNYFLRKNELERQYGASIETIHSRANDVYNWQKNMKIIPKDLNIIIEDFEVKYSKIEQNKDHYIFDNQNERKIHKSKFNPFMKESTPAPKKLFISYSHKDYNYLQRMEVHLSSLRRDGMIEDWNDTKFEIGDKWDSKIKEKINESDIFILLISADFINSDYIWKVELEMIKKAEQERGALVIPVIVEDCDWTNLDYISEKQAETYKEKGAEGSKDDKKELITVVPIEEYTHPSKAYTQIVKKIRNFISKTK